jgi:nucleoside-diphosphate kinase
MKLWFLTSLAAASLLFSAEEQTLAIIKPDAVEGQHVGEILARYEQEGFKIKSAKMVQLSQEEAMKFYEVHKERPFYRDLTAYMSSGPIVALVLEADGAVLKNRELMGSTNPEQAKEGTLRKAFGQSLQRNAVHGSDSCENAQNEIAFFFSE